MLGYCSTFTADPECYSEFVAETLCAVCGSCQSVRVLGCTHSQASNYNASANVDDGQCRFADCVQVASVSPAVTGCPDGWRATNQFGGLSACVRETASGCSSAYFPVPDGGAYQVIIGSVGVRSWGQLDGIRGASLTSLLLP
jgi:hypothetical protein